MADIVIRAPEPGDVDALVANMRQADRDEVEGLRGPGMERDSLEIGLRISVLVWTATVDGEVACMFGVAPLSLLGGRGVPWLLGTPLIDRNRGAFIRHGRAYIARMLALFPSLLNLVDARNTCAIRWLKRAGFTVHAAQPIGMGGLLYHPFTLEARDV